MNKSALLEMSLEQVAQQLGDPTALVFRKLAQACPALLDYTDQQDGWQPYMMQEILGHLLQFHEDPETSLAILREMACHHQLIGLPDAVFQSFYPVLLDTVEPCLSGAHRDAMVAVWRETVALIDAQLTRCL